MDLPTQLSEEDLKDAETLLDTLLGSNTSPEESTPARQGQPTADILKAAVDSEGLSDSGFQVRRRVTSQAATNVDMK